MKIASWTLLMFWLVGSVVGRYVGSTYEGDIATKGGFGVLCVM